MIIQIYVMCVIFDLPQSGVVYNLYNILYNIIFVCLYVYNTITFKSLDVRNLFSPIRHNVNLISSNSISITHRSLKFACSVWFSAMVDRMV